jgi:ubiquinone/menaquinone biosynthesis C-methylase UbiE
MYDSSAEHYDAMMDDEIDLPVYADLFERLALRLARVPGPLVDSSCGTGHMLARYHESYEASRELLGFDLAPRMVEIAREKLRGIAAVEVGDMRQLTGVAAGSAAAVISFFALHHLDPDGASAAFAEWHRALRPGGQLVVGTWEGVGAIDYGGTADVVALRYGREVVRGWATDAGFVADRCVVEPVDGMPMDAVYLEATRL